MARFRRADTYLKENFLSFEVDVSEATPSWKVKARFGKLVHVAARARDMYVEIRRLVDPARPGAAHWMLAVDTRIGEIHFHEAEKALAMRARMALIQTLGPATAAKLRWREGKLQTYAGNRKRDARRLWDGVVNRSEKLCLESEWTERARANLAMASAGTHVRAVFGGIAEREENYLFRDGNYLSSSPLNTEDNLRPLGLDGDGSTAVLPPLGSDPTDIHIESQRASVQCKFAVIIGNGGDDANIGPMASAAFKYTAPENNWYYMLARCNAEPAPLIDQYFFQSSDNRVLRHVMRGVSPDH